MLYPPADITVLLGIAYITVLDTVIEHKLRRICIRDIRVDKIRPNPFQPRMSCEEQELLQLVESIKSAGGLVHPITVRWKNGFYEIATGYRRWLAYKTLSEKTIPAIICVLSDKEMLETALVENVQRKNLNPIEEAKGFALLKKKFDMRYEDIGQKVGKTKDYVAQRIRLLSLPYKIRKLLSRDKINTSIAEAMASRPADIQNRVISMIEAGHTPTVKQILQLTLIETAEQRSNGQSTRPSATGLPPGTIAPQTILDPPVNLTAAVWGYYQHRRSHSGETITEFVHRVIINYFGHLSEVVTRSS